MQPNGLFPIIKLVDLYLCHVSSSARLHMSQYGIHVSIFSGESYEDETQDSSDYGAESRNSQGRLPEELQFLKTRDLLCHLAQHLQQELASRVRFDLTSKVTKGWSSSVDSTYLNQLRHNLVLKTLKQADAGRAFHCVTAGLHGELFDLLLNTPELINVRDTSGCGLLHRAVEKGYAEMVNLLVSRGIDINAENNVGDCPLHLAVQTSRIDIVTKLLEYGANPRCTNKEGEQPIHMAAQVNFVEGVKLLLIYPEVIVDCLDARKSTPLHHCCLADSEDCLKMLLEHGANIYQRNVFGSASIHIAIFQVALKCANALFEYEQLKMCQGALLNPSTASVQQDASTPRKKKTSLLSFLTEKTGSARLERRRSSRQPSVPSTVSDSDMHQLVHMMDEEGFSPLHMAVHSGNIELIKMCLDRGADILGSDKSGHSALHFACARGDLECAKLLFEYGQRVALRMIFAVDQDGRTPMHMAAMHNHPDLIDFLLEKGADMNPTDSKGLTPLLLACQKGSIKATKHLLEIGADIYKCDENGRNLSILLLLGGTGDAREVVPVLVKMGTLPVLFTQPDRYGCTYMHVAARLGQRVAIKIGLANGGKLLQRDSEGSTALHSAARFGRLDICRQMLETTEGKRALFLRDYSGRSPLHVAAQYGNNRVVEYLLAKGGFYHRCNDGNTPLHYAAMFGNAQTCDMLLEINPSVLNYTNYVGSTALHIAAQHDNAGVVSYLLSAGAEILPDKNGLYFTIQAFHSDNYAASEAIAVHSR
ncbi:unnamed protein product [Dicrocoelium dendriticum]|nr:unnamed protein product [Dicrocoelium dendriticum]